MHCTSNIECILTTDGDLAALLCVCSQVQFQVSDAVTVNLPAASFDAIYSRDSILHIPFEQRIALFKNCFVRHELSTYLYTKGCPDRGSGTKFCSLAKFIWFFELYFV